MNRYGNRDVVALGAFYTQHVSAMTTEGLHAKSDIAAELAWRDQQINDISSRLDVVSKEVEGMEVLLEKEHNDLLAWKHRATSAEDRLEAVLKLAREGTPDAETRGDEDGHYAQGQIDLGKAIKAILVERQPPNVCSRCKIHPRTSPLLCDHCIEELGHA